MRLVIEMLWMIGGVVTVIWAFSYLQYRRTRELIDDIKRNDRIVGVEDGAIVLSDGRRIRPHTDGPQ